MLKRTLFFGSPVRLSLRMKQMAISFVEDDRDHQTIPLEDIGMVVLEHPHISLSHPLLSACMDNKVTVVCCSSKHIPSGIMVPMEGHSEMQQRMRWQLQMSEPLRKQLWKQVVQAKIANQATVLDQVGKDCRPVLSLVDQVKPGDTSNVEGHAAACYWQMVYDEFYPQFMRDRNLAMVNPLLNYGYALLRAAAARAVVGAGLLVSYGLFHKSKYNAYALADDLMEPFRPYIDRGCYDMLLEFGPQGVNELSFIHKERLLKQLTQDVVMDKVTSPLQIALQRSAVSLVHCLSGERRKLLLPSL